jgi:hypothetical protein
MLREIGLATIILIILTAAVVIAALSQTTTLGPLAGHVGVNDETALSWGQALEPEATSEAMVEPTEAVTEESEDATPEAESTEEE